MVNLSRESSTSKVLNLLRFPLAALVVFIHTPFSNNHSDISFYIGTFISEELATIAVPTFFFISGYLFFAKYNVFEWKQYSRAMKRKFSTLVIPYILWNALIFYGYGMLHGFELGISPFDLYKIFWAQSDGYVATSIFGYQFSILSSPYLGVLWFIRDLIVAMMFTPLFWHIITRLRFYSIFLFLVPYLLYIAIPIKGFGLVALTFFPIGATFSICGTDIVQGLKGYNKIIISLFLISLLTKFGLDISGISYHRLLGQIVIISGVAASLVLADFSLKFARISTALIILGEASFFIYVGHTLPIFNLLKKLELIQIIPHIGFSLYYILSWCLRISIVVVIYFAMKKVCPQILSVLVGGRLTNKPMLMKEAS